MEIERKESGSMVGRRKREKKKRRMYEYDLFVLAKIYLYNVLKNKSSMDDSV